MEKFLTQSWPWWIVAGASLGLAQLFALAWPLTLAGVAFAVVAAARSNGWKEVLWGALVFGTLKCLGGYTWIWAAYPIAWLEIDSLALQFVLVALFWITTSIFMGAGMVLPALIAWYWRQRTLALCLFFPAAWVAGEVLGSFLASVWLLGPGGYLNIYLGHGYAGLPLSQIEVLWPVMVLAGMYGLTYWAALFGALIGRLTVETNPMAACLVALMVFVLVLNLALPKPNTDYSEVRVVAIDTSFTTKLLQTPDGRMLKGREVLAAVEAALNTGAGIILLPEDSRITNLFDSPEETLTYLRSLAPSSETVVVDSGRIDIGHGQVALRAYYYDLGTGDIYMTDKQFLVPQGEYVTYPFRFLLRLTGQSGFLAGIDQNQNYVPGPLVGYDGFPNHLPTMLFCSESSSVLGTRGESKLVLHPVSHARFHDSGVLKYQLSSMLRVLAVWRGVTIVVAGNMAESQIYKTDGSIESGEIFRRSPLWKLVEYGL